MAQGQLPQEAMMAALQAVHKQGVDTDPNTGAPYGQPAATGAAPDQGVPPDQAAAGGAAGGDTQQAVWTEFPGTDPQQVEALAQQAAQAGPDQLVELINAFMQQADADREKLDQMHQSMAEHLMQLLSGPSPEASTAAPAGAPAPQGPGVGGQGAGY